MFRLVATTLAGIYVVLAIWGEPEGSVETTRAAGMNTTLAPGSAAEAEAGGDAAPMEADLRHVSADEAVARALAAAQAETPQAERTAEPTENVEVESAEAAPDARWYVTGSAVNLRAGPSSDQPVVGQVGLGDRAEPLSDTDAAWVRVRTGDGTEAWIFGRFLSETPA